MSADTQMQLRVPFNQPACPAASAPQKSHIPGQKGQAGRESPFLRPARGPQEKFLSCKKCRSRAAG